MSDWLDDGNYSDVLSKLCDENLTFCRSFKQCSGFDRGFFGKLGDKWIFAKLAKAENDYSLCDEYNNGLKINHIRNEIPNFLYTYSLTRVKKCHFPTGKYKFPRDVLFTEYVNEKLLYHYVKNTIFITLLAWFQQLAVVLDYSYKKIGFQHGDCHIANIVIKNCQTPVSIKYDNIIIHVDVICILYDFGKTKFIDHTIDLTTKESTSKPVNGIIDDLKTACNSIFKWRFREEMLIIEEYLKQWVDIEEFLSWCDRTWNLDIRVGDNKQMSMVYSNNENISSSMKRNETFSYRVSYSSPNNQIADIEQYLKNGETIVDISHITHNKSNLDSQAIQKKKKNSSFYKKNTNDIPIVKDKNYVAPIAPWINVPKVQAVSIHELLSSSTIGI